MKIGLFRKSYTLRELMDMRDSLGSKIRKDMGYVENIENLEEVEYDQRNLEGAAMEFNLVLVKEQVDVANSPVKALIFQRALIDARIKFAERLENNLTDEGINRPFIRKISDSKKELEQHLKDIDTELTNFNDNVKISLDLLDLTKITDEKVKPKKKGKS